MHRWVPWHGLGKGTPGPRFRHCEFLWCQELSKNIRFLDAACGGISTEYCDPFFSVSGRAPAMRGGRLFSWILSSTTSIGPGSECKLGYSWGHKDMFGLHRGGQVAGSETCGVFPGDSGCVPSFMVRGWCVKESDFYASLQYFTVGRRLGWQWQAWVIFLCRNSCPALGSLHLRQEIFTKLFTDVSIPCQRGLRRNASYLSPFVLQEVLASGLCGY